VFFGVAFGLPIIFEVSGVANPDNSTYICLGSWILAIVLSNLVSYAMRSQRAYEPEPYTRAQYQQSKYPQQHTPQYSQQPSSPQHPQQSQPRPASPRYPSYNERIRQDQRYTKTPAQYQPPGTRAKKGSLLADHTCRYCGGPVNLKTRKCDYCGKRT
jgi:hypothetical protein